MSGRHIKILVFLIIVFLQAAPSHAAEKLIAALLTADLPRYKDAHRAFVKSLAHRGYNDTKVEIIVQTPNPDPLSWANSVRKFVAIGADLIVTYGAPATLAALEEGGDIPIVFADVYDPVETGVSRSMTTTGRNACGVSSKVPMITLVKTLQDIKPFRSIGILYNAKEAGSRAQLKELKRVAAQLGLSVVEANVSSARALDSAISFLIPRVDSIYVSESAVVSKGFERVILKANSRKIPVISQMHDAADRGALIALEVNPAEQGRIAGDYAADVLNGKKPAHMSIATPKKIDMIVNMKAARYLELNVPFQVLSMATKVLK